MTVGTFTQPDHTIQTGTVYKVAIKNSTMVMARLAAAFAPHEQAVPDMTILVDAGDLWVNGALVQKSAQNSATIVKPSGSNHRIDRVVVDAITGIVSVITGTPIVGSPAVPAITAGKFPICQVALAHDMAAAITNDLITDERIPMVSVTAGLTKVSEVTLSGSSPYVISTSLVAGKRYKLIMTAIQNTTAGYFYGQFNEDVGANHYYSQCMYNSVGVVQGGYPIPPTATGTVGFGLTHATPSTAHLVLPTTIISAEILIYCPIGSLRTQAQMFCTYQENTSGLVCGINTSGVYAGAADLSKFRIITSAGTLTGTVAIYEMV